MTPSSPPPSPPSSPPPPRDPLAARRGARRTLVLCTLGIGAMVGASFAAVPLYDAFCRAFGIGGAPRIADAAAPTRASDGARLMQVRFDANLAAGLPWRFEAPEPVTVPIGESTRIAYRARSRADAPTTGRAVFSVTPAQAAYYFVKIECFCFQEQTLAAGEDVEMTALFHIDPEIEDDRELDAVRTVTLSYTFFPSAPRQTAAAAEPTR